MKFRPKFGLIGWIFAFNALLFDLSWFITGHETIFGKIDAVTMTALTIFQAQRTRLTYWRVDNGFLYEQRFWKSRIVPCGQIQRVSAQTWKRSKPRFIAIDWFQGGTIEKAGRLYADPANPPQFIRALQQFVPENAFDI